MLRFVKKLTWMTALVLLAVCMVASPAVTPAHANGPPGIPHILYGYAYIDGSLASTGKTVVAKISGVQVGSTTVSSAPGYNYQLQVSSDTSGTIDFYVDGVLATSTFPYTAGGYTLLDLYTYTTTLGVTTCSASSITSNSATLNGTLTGLGSGPTVYVSFQYGLTTSYGSTTPAQPMSSLGTFNAPITGLATSTTYHFRAKVTDGGTTEYGDDAEFTTTTPVLTVSTGSASGVTTSTATLSGTLSDLGGNSSVSVSFEYGKTDSYGSTTTPQAMNNPGPFSATISSLDTGTLYHFRAKAVGSTAYGSDATFTTSSQSSGCSSGCCHWFWGTAYLNGSAVASGSVAALVNGSASGASTTTNASGGYNIYVPVTGGSTVTFTVDGIPAEQSTTGSCMGYNGNYNLHTTTATLTITNSTGANNIQPTSARLNGAVVATGGEDPTVHIYWGDNDGGTTAGNWDNDVNLGVKSLSTFYTDISSLTSGNTYYYRCYGSNSTASDWADATSSFQAGSTPIGDQIIGADDAEVDTSWPADQFRMFRFLALKNGPVDTMKVKPWMNGWIRMAIYADASGEPGDLLNETAGGL
ncbi:MAG: hypothetical protein JRD68_14315, partial [Deltaproteobacteria bacterium]|nr:hypothetical protein [Deltaproteobacteria bacterium]